MKSENDSSLYRDVLFAIGAVLIALSLGYYEIFFPKPTLDLKYEAKEISIISAKYQREIENHLYIYSRFSKEIYLIRKKYRNKVGKISENLKTKISLGDEIYRRIVKYEERDKEKEHKKLIERFYNIDDLERLKEILKEVKLLYAIKNNPKQINDIVSKLTTNSMILHKGLTKVYKKLDNDFSRKKQALIDSSIDRTKDNYNNFLTFKMDDDHEKIFNVINESRTIFEQLKELDSSKIKILKDMDMKFFVQIGRSSWKSTSDAGDTNFLYNFVEVQRKDFIEAQRYPYSIILKAKLNDRLNMPRHHDSTEFWLNDRKVKYLHKYTYIIGNKIRESDWKEVEEEFYWEKHPALGMEVYSKSVGIFNSEASDRSLPIGGNFVGNKLYGEWQGDIWVWNSYLSGVIDKFTIKNYSKAEYNRWQKKLILTKPMENNSSSNYSRGGSGGFGSVYYSAHDDYWEEDKRRYERKMETIRGTSDSHMGRGASAGGK